MQWICLGWGEFPCWVAEWLVHLPSIYTCSSSWQKIQESFTCCKETKQPTKRQEELATYRGNEASTVGILKRNLYINPYYIFPNISNPFFVRERETDRQTDRERDRQRDRERQTERRQEGEHTQREVRDRERGERDSQTERRERERKGNRKRKRKRERSNPTNLPPWNRLHTHPARESCLPLLHHPDSMHWEQKLAAPVSVFYCYFMDQ